MVWADFFVPFLCEVTAKKPLDLDILLISKKNAGAARED
jgi:hypothetical protein